MEGFIDPKDQQAYDELNKKIYETYKKINSLVSTKKYKERNILESQLMIKQLTPIPDDCKTYKAIGKTYFLSNKDEMIKSLEEKEKELGKELEMMNVRQKKLEEELKEDENSLKELLNTSSALNAAIKNMS